MEAPSSSYRGHLVLLLAPSGSGKRTLVEHITATFPDIYFAKTFTSRARREGASENPKYEFVSTTDFEQLIAKGELVEWAKYSGNYYGTPRSEFEDGLKNGALVCKEMELQGVEQIKKLFPASHLTVVFIDGGPWEKLKRRIVNRAPISEEELELRRQHYEEEMKSKPLADVVIDNSDGRLHKAKKELEAVFQNILHTINS